MEVFCGIDWAETHHDVAVVDESGRRLAKQRITDDLAGFTALAALLAEVTVDVAGGGFVAVDIALETDRGLMVAALRAAGHRVFAINPKAVDRYRDRYGTSGAKSDPGDALVLANVLRTDRHAHRPLPADSDDVAAIGVLARAHHDAVRRRVAEANRLRNLLREFFPAALEAFPDLTTRTALALLAAAPTPAAAARLSRARLAALIKAAGRGTLPGEVERLRGIFHATQLRQPPAVETAMGHATAALVATLTACDTAVRDLEKTLERAVGEHPDAPILDTLPACGAVLAGRMLAEFGDDRARFPDAAARRAYAGTSPVTRASGKSRAVVMRRGGNQRLVDTCRTWAFATLVRSPGARAHYDRRRAAGDRHEAALRNLANKLISQLDHCLRHRVPWNETTAWPSAVDAAAA
jgi:transposase